MVLLLLVFLAYSTFVASKMFPETESKWRTQNIKERKLEVKTSYDFTLKSKVEEEAGKVYIRRLQVTPSPACVLASDRQVQDVKRFCANTTNTFSALSIDTTFNIDDFYVTPTAYRHLLLADRRTGKPPLLIIDSDGCKDFDAKLESLENVWNSREKKWRCAVLSNSSEAEFHKYFVANVAENIKKKMIAPVRKRAGLRESFFNNNGAESKRQRIKAREGQMYGEWKRAWTEVVDLLKEEEEERNCERAIVDEGPYKIGQPYSSKLQVAFSTYISKSHAQNEKFNKRVHELTMEAALIQENVSVNHAKKNFTEYAYKNVPKSVGGKPGEAERKRKRLPQTQRSTSEYRERIATPLKPTLDTTTFKV